MTSKTYVEIKFHFDRKIHVRITHARMEGKQSQMPILSATSVNVLLDTKESTVQLVRRNHI